MELYQSACTQGTKRSSAYHVHKSDPCSVLLNRLPFPTDTSDGADEISGSQDEFVEEDPLWLMIHRV